MATTDNAPACPYCGEQAKLVTGKEIYPRRRDLWRHRYWQCIPCSAYVGCHRESTEPLGRLANAELRKAKMRAHNALDPMWRSSAPFDRSAAYEWLAEKLGIPRSECHIGMFDVETCDRVVAACKTYLRKGKIDE